MYKELTVAAVVVAAGRGSRMNSPLAKQYLCVNDKPLLAYSLSALQQCGIIDHILVVVAQDDMLRCRQDVVRRFSLGKVRDILVGGITRQQSVAAGLEAVKENIVVIHDGARPLIDSDLINQGIKKLVEQGLDGVACAVPVKDTIKLVDDFGNVKKTLNRAELRAVQTPQCFIAEKIKKAHERAAIDGIEATDDLAVLEHYGYRTGLYPGQYDNIKITTPEDLTLMKALMGERSKQ